MLPLTAHIVLTQNVQERSSLLGKVVHRIVCR